MRSAGFNSISKPAESRPPSATGAADTFERATLVQWDTPTVQPFAADISEAACDHGLREAFRRLDAMAFQALEMTPKAPPLSVVAASIQVTPGNIMMRVLGVILVLAGSALLYVTVTDKGVRFL